MKRRMLAALVAILMVIFMAGCSTPSVAVSVDDRDYSTGEYLAYLYSNAYTVYYYYQNYGDVNAMWDQTLPYENPYTTTDDEKETSGETSDGAGDNTLPVADYIKTETIDEITYLAAIEAIMKEKGIEISKEDQAAALSSAQGMTDAEKLGFSSDNYYKMMLSSGYSSNTLFKALYDKGGEKAVEESKIKDYFKKNYLTYEMIQITIADADGNDLSEAEVEKVRTRLEGYKEVYEKTGDFDKAIAAYDAETGSEEETSKPEETESEGGLQPDGTIKNVTSNNSENVRELNAATSTDIDLINAVRSVDEGDVQIVQYNQGGTSPMLALIYRIQPDGKGRENYYEDSRMSVLNDLMGDEYQKLIVDKMKTMKVVKNERAIKMCDPKNFFA